MRNPGDTVRRRCSTSAALVAALLLSGCFAATPTQYYLLAPVVDGVDASSRTAGIDEPTIGVGPIVIPEHLRRPQIVTRSSANQLELSEFHRWAESLDDNVSDVLGETVGILIGTERIAPFPFAGGVDVDYQIAVEIIRMDADADGTAVLSARWGLYRGQGGTNLLIVRHTVVREVPDGKGYGPLVAALSRALKTLGVEIAAELEQHVS